MIYARSKHTRCFGVSSGFFDTISDKINSKILKAALTLVEPKSTPFLNVSYSCFGLETAPAPLKKPKMTKLSKMLYVPYI